jgi:2-polyprenyl-3-methyl-5-hydroxy-6-metoxy-1,4-benzoquinol methylase
MRLGAFPFLKHVLPPAVYSWAKDIRNARQVKVNPGRVVLEREILPAYAALGGRVLWIGCRRYTRGYGALLSRNGAEVWTTDIEVANARWGQPGRHVTVDLLLINGLIASESFDSVLCNGIFGFGVDTRETQLAALKAIWAILKPGGQLLLGWNTDRVEDPLAFDFVQSAFVGDALTTRGARYAVPEAIYVYDFLRRRQAQ